MGHATPQGKADPLDDLVVEAQRLLRGEDAEGALELLEAAARHDPERLELHGWAEGVRARLLRRYRESTGNGRGVPRARLSGNDLLRFNLPPEAGLLLSLMDGATSVEEMLSVAGIEEFRALRALHHLLEAGIVEVGT